MDADFPLLAMLAVGPANAHRLLRELERTGIPASRSTVYRRVEALLSAGLLDAREARQPRRGPGRPVRSLHLTERGLRLAADEAMDQVAHAPVDSPTFLLALACAASLAEPDLGRVLRGRLAEARLAREETAQELQWLAGRAPAWRVAEVRRRLAHLTADVEWIEEVLREVAGPGGGRQSA
jgi:DNA-binding PadR family transcriptional regulator